MTINIPRFDFKRHTALHGREVLNLSKRWVAAWRGHIQSHGRRISAAHHAFEACDQRFLRSRRGADEVKLRGERIRGNNSVIWQNEDGVCIWRESIQRLDKLPQARLFDNTDHSSKFGITGGVVNGADEDERAFVKR